MSDIVERMRAASLQTDCGLDIDKELLDEGWREIERLRVIEAAAENVWEAVEKTNDQHEWLEPLAALARALEQK